MRKLKNTLKSLRRPKETIYISGPMNGMGPDFNYPAFNAMAVILRKAGYKVLNPAENFKGDYTRQRPEYMRLDFQHVLNATRLVVLPLWETSIGANLEVLVAREMGVPISHVQFPIGASSDGTEFLFMHVPANEVEDNLRAKCAALRTAATSTSTPPALPVLETICQEADRLVSTDRQATYGHPKDDFTKTAEMLNGAGYRRMSYRTGQTDKLTARDIPIVMFMVKISRLLNGYHRDSAVDLAGYAKTLDMVVAKEKEIEAAEMAVAKGYADAEKAADWFKG